MPRVPADYVPAYRLHKSSGQAVVTLSAKDYLLGTYGTPDSKAKYHRLIADWLAAGRKPFDVKPELLNQYKAPPMSVNTLADAFQRFANTHYARPGKRGGNADVFRLILRDVRDLFGTTPACEFSPSKLKAVRERWINRKYARKTINQYCGSIRRVFRWGVGEELVPADVIKPLECVEPLRYKKTTARESVPVRPVPLVDIEAIRPHVAPQVWAMVQLQLYAGPRGDEIFRLRAIDIDMSGDVWTYKPGDHKTAGHGVPRTIHFGAKCQDAIRPFLSFRPVDVPLFSPIEAAKYHKMKAATKGKPRRPNQKPNARKSARVIRQTYDDASYRKAIQSGCDRAKVDRWTPHRLLHNYSTEVARRHGIEAARAARGHTSIDTTMLYAERDAAIGRMVAEEIG